VPLRFSCTQGMASSSTGKTSCPTVTFGEEPATVTVMTSPPVESKATRCTVYSSSPVRRSDRCLPSAQLFAPAPPDETMDVEQQVAAETLVPQNADVIAVYPSRAEFAARVPPANLLAGARDVRAAGLSPNMICQQVPDQTLQQLIEDGAEFRCLFLTPQGQATRDREREEGHRPGRLSTLTELNMLMLTDRVRSRLSAKRVNASRWLHTTRQYDSILSWSTTGSA
jgi:hypothetical protein